VIATARHAPATARLGRIEARLERRARTARNQALRMLRTPQRTHIVAAGPPVCDGLRATIVGTNGDDTINGTPGHDIIAALGGNDTIYGRGQNDLICTGDGDDLAWGDGGNDRIFGGDGHDLLDGGNGDDFVDGGAGRFDGAAFFDESAPVTGSLDTGTATGQGSDTFTNVEQLHGGKFDDILTGNASDNGLFGNSGNDKVSGGDGNDSLSGGFGDDVIDGGNGTFDSVSFWDATGPVTASLATGTSSGGDEGSDSFTNVEVLNGGPYSDTLTGNDGDNSLWGAGGNDTLTGAGGNDFVDGGAGDDTMDGGGQQFDAAAFFDESGPVTASLATGTATGDGSDTFTNVRQLHGGDFADTFNGDGADNSLFGNGGNDTLSAGDGSDNISGGYGDDAIDGGGGPDSVNFWDANGPVTASLATGTSSGGGEGSDSFTNVEIVFGGPYGDTLSGNDGDNSLWGVAGNDVLFGGDGNDFLVPGSGTDTLDGGAGGSDAAAYWDAVGPITANLATGATGDGDDSYANIEQIHGSQYGDNLTSAGNGWLFGNEGADTVNGGNGNDFLFGGVGDDRITAGEGDDFLVPGAGSDVLDGGPGLDRAAYWDANGPITASLVTGSATGDGTDTYANLEGIHGGNYGDTIIGDAAGNDLFGNDGNDSLYGGAGNDSMNGWLGDDSLYGEAGDDYLNGEAGTDFLDGGADWDYCENGETVFNCEQPPGSLVFDDFNDDSLDSARWTPFGLGSGPQLAETGHQIQIDLPATSTDDPAQGIFAVGIAGNCAIRGDFDMQVEYALPVWPPGNGVRIALAAAFGNVERQTDPGAGSGVYLVSAPGIVRGLTPTSDLSGALRLRREGSTLFGYYRSGDQWVLLASWMTTADDASYGLQAWSHDVLFADMDVRVTFDNFRITQGQRIC
jgi:Ca2+-binding RTX toxin-like protein